jgi:hypothetical protein
VESDAARVERDHDGRDAEYQQVEKRNGADASGDVLVGDGPAETDRLSTVGQPTEDFPSINLNFVEMATSTRTPDTRTLSGILAGLGVLGIALLVANVPSSPLRSGSLELFALFALPLVIALVAYLRFAEPVVWWELTLLGVWGALSIAVTTFVGFLATMGTPGGYPGSAVELGRNIALFLAVTLGLGVPYSLAGTFRREHPRRAVVSALLGSVVLFVLVNGVAVAV